MKPLLLHRDRDFDPHQQLPPNAQALTQDLGLDKLFDVMAAGDRFLFEVAKQAVFSCLADPAEIVYRQHILNDCLEQPSTVREIYDIAVETIVEEKKTLHFFSKSPDLVLHRAVEALRLFVGMLKRLRRVADEHADEFRSEGFTAFFEMLTKELSDEYFHTIEEHLTQLEFRHGVLISAQLGKGIKGIGYIVRRPQQPKGGWRQRISIKSRYTVVIADRDEAGAQALAELRGRGINVVANALAQSTEHILSFFTMLRAELGFYLGCLNVHRQLTDKGEPVCFPTPVGSGRSVLSAHNLYDICLTLRMAERVVSNDVSANDKRLVMITGANQGGKSTFLRSIGLAQLMMQCGMFVAAESFCANVVAGLFTHYKREEDVTMNSGKLDEELSRMSEIADRIAPNCMVLLNESFSATNESEGSEIATSIVRVLLEAGIKVFFVTHSFELANGFHRQTMDGALFLRAQRRDDGQRTFRLVEGEPLPTSYGKDLYRHIFEAT